MATDDIYSIAVDFQLYDVVGTNVMFFRIVTDPGAGTPEESLKAAWDADIKPEWLLALHADTRLFCQRIKQWRPTESPEIVYTLDATNVGAISGGEALPASSVMILSLYTGQFDRRGRGRQFISGIAEDGETNGQISIAQFQALQALGAVFSPNLTDPVNAGVWSSVIYSTDLATDNDVIRYEARSRVYSHRSRTGRRCAAP